MITLLMDAYEKRDVATADVPGAYLFADINENILIKINGTSTDIMCKVNPSYKKYVTNERGKRTLYLKLTKALYGCMQSALLWYNTFKECLEELGFKLNPYDPCVANMMLEGEQCTVCWYVDDTKISHKKSEIVDWVIGKLEENFGKMTVKRGKKHTFVGIDIEFNEDRTVSLSMNDYIQECIDIYDTKLKRSASTPAKGDLFDEDDEEEAETLPKVQADKYHHTTAKLLFLAKRVRIDIDLAISFLCTKVSKPTIGDEIKLKRVLSYLKRTKDLKRNMGMNSTGYLQTWIDASYATHRDMRGHTGGVISMGHGTVIHGCSKQKINTKSSTESEVVGVSDFLPYTMWASYFLREQGYLLKRNIFYQDNTSAIKMLRNGKESCGSKSRHIHIRYFFTKDVLKRENMNIEHCATEDMIADFYTKPLQGKQFYKLRDVIMALDTSTVKECVEGNDEKATVDRTRKPVSRKHGTGNQDTKYKISNNFD